MLSDLTLTCSILVVGTDPGSKAQKAEELGIETLDEAAFERILARADRTGMYCCPHTSISLLLSS